MKGKKLLAVLLAIVFALPPNLGSPSGAGLSTSYAAGAETSGHGYYYGQLSDREKSYYEAMCKMYEQGIFKTGSQSFDLADNGYVTQDELKAYLSGDTDLFFSVGAARDAFCAEHPEIFYVDFNKFAMRVTCDSQGKYHANLGSSREGSYYVQGFSNAQEVDAAIAEFDKRVDEIVAGANALTAEGALSLNATRIKYVHNELIDHASYRLEDVCKPENTGHVRTSYGVLVKGEGVCEAYAEAFKTVMDKLGIPCILVSGIYRHSESVSELHMWNYVQLENGGWYAVDATMDDPYREDLSTNGGVDGFENTDYLLAGDDVMGRNHATSGILSSSNREFIYPQLAIESIPLDRVSTGKDLVVDLKETVFEGVSAGEYHISYKGMGYAKAAATGKYMIAKMYIYYELTDELIFNDWAYITPELYPAMEDTDTELILRLPQCQYAEFAVTDRAPGDYLSDPGRLYYQGDPLLIEEDTGMLQNPYANYVAPPYIKTITPGISSRMFIGSTYHVKAVYDDKLKLAEGATEAGYRIEVPTEGATGVQYCKLNNFSWDGESTIEFDFTPSEMWADDCIAYQIHITGLVGERSEKAPNFIGYFASHRCAVCAYKSQGYDWNVFGKPALMENTDLSTTDWKTSDGSPIADSLKHRMVLVATSPTHAQTDAMNQMVEQTFPEEEVLKSETYNINLTVCKKQVIQPGQGVRVSVGFPPGYGPEDEGVTFKAYHFIKNEAGDLVGVEEIPCVVTKYGLLVTCRSFSPFTIAAVKDDGKQEVSEKTVILSDTMGGTITGAESNLFTLAKGQSKQITIQAQDGYELEEVVVAGAVQKVTDKHSMTISLHYDDLSDEANIVDAKFVAATVRAQEAARGEEAVQPAASPAKIKLPAGPIYVKENEPLQITADVSSDGLLTYQWYKDGAVLPGQTSRDLSIGAVSSQDAGEYKLVVTTTVDTTNAQSTSEACTVIIGEKPETPLAKVSGLKATSSSVGRVKLSWKKAAGADGYQVLRYDASKKKFVTVASVISRSYVDKKLTAGTACRYKVRAYREEDGNVKTGAASKEAKVIVKPKTPSKLTAKRLSDSSAKITFSAPKGNANVEYQILKYDKSKKKFALAYRVKKNKLSQYNAKTKKWKSIGKAKTSKKGTVSFTLTGLKGKKLKYRIQAVVSKSGYKSANSAASKTVTLK